MTLVYITINNNSYLLYTLRLSSTAEKQMQTNASFKRFSVLLLILLFLGLNISLLADNRFMGTSLMSTQSTSEKSYYTVAQSNSVLGGELAVSEWQRFVGTTTVNEQINRLQNWVDDETLEPLIKEKLLFDATLTFRNVHFSSTESQLLGRNAMESLLTYQSRAYLPLWDAGRQLQIAAFQVAASAQATLIHWNIENEYRQSSALAELEPRVFLKQLAKLTTMQKSFTQHSEFVKSKVHQSILGFKKTLDMASIETLNSLSIELQNRTLIISDHALLILAQKLSNINLFQRLFTQYSSGSIDQTKIISALSHLPDNFSVEEKVALLKIAMTSDDLRSPSILILGQFVDAGAGVLQKLNSELSDAKFGGAAAKAMSQSTDLLTLELLQKNLQSDDMLVVRRSLLTLYFIKNKEASNTQLKALVLLQRFHKDTHNPQLKREVAQWLL